MFSRSTKGASKQRRELINVEISSIRDLLPLQEGVRKRLSQLQVMAICKAFIGKNNFFDKMPELNNVSSEDSHFFDFSQALPGFLLMATLDGKFLYLSDNVMEILGHSMVDMITQSETIFDLFDERGQAKVMELVTDENMTSSGECSQDETVTFTCLMGLTKNVRRHPGLDRQKVMTVRASLFRPRNGLQVEEPVLVAFCSPCSTMIPNGEPVPVFNTMVFQTRHSLDMKLRSIEANGEFHLGYSAKELRSWYGIIHPQHESEFAAIHLELISSGTDSVSSVFFRVQTKYGHFIWLHVMMRLINDIDICNGQSEIACVCQVLDEEQVAFKKERETLEAEMGNYGNTQAFDSSLCLYGSNGMASGYSPMSYMTSPGPVWTETASGRRGKRKAGNDNMYGKSRRMNMMQSPSSSEDTISSTTTSTVSFSSPIRIDVDQAFQFAPVDAFPGSSSSYQNVFQADFNLSAEDPVHLNASSPYSILSDSACGSSPRMYPEDDGSFFIPMPNVAEQKNNLSFGDIKVLDDLSEIKNLNQDLGILPSPLQEVPNELPELDLSDVYDYLRTVEDFKKQELIQNYIESSSYAEGSQQTATNWKVSNPTGVAYDCQTVQTGGCFNFEKQVPENVSSNGGAAAFSGPAFLERLIESPHFTELIGMMANGGSQRRFNLQEQGLPCFG